MNTVYIKVILTVIAIELGVIIFKNPVSNIPVVDPDQEHSAVVQTKSSMPNAWAYAQDAPLKVEIVDINMNGWSLPYKKMLPVNLCKPSGIQAQAVEYPLPVKETPK